MRRVFFKTQLAGLVLFTLVVSLPLTASAQESHLARVLGRVRSLLTFAGPETEKKFDPGRRRFLQIAGATSAVLMADPSHLIQMATGTANTGGMAAHEIYSLFKMQSMVPPETLARLNWAAHFGMPAGSFTTVDLARFAAMRTQAGVFAEHATTAAGRAYGAQLISSTNACITAAFSDVNAVVQAARPLAPGQAQASQKGGPGQSATQTTETQNLVRVLTLSELIPSDVQRRLEWAETYQSQANLNYDETLRFVFYAAGAAIAAEQVTLTSEERVLFQNMADYAKSILTRVNLDRKAVLLVRRDLSLEELQTEPALEPIRHTLQKVGGDKFFAPVCHQVFRIPF